MTAPTNAGYAALGAEIQEGLQSAGDYLQNGGRILGGLSIVGATYSEG